MTLKHIHTYRRSKWNKNTFQCADPGCTSYANKLKIVGKKSLCNNCGTEIVLTAYNLTTTYPKCDLCSDTKKSKLLRSIGESTELQDVFSRMGEEPEALEGLTDDFLKET